MSRKNRNKKNRRAYLAEVRAMDSSITNPSNKPAPAAVEATETASEDDHKVINLSGIMNNPDSDRHADELYQSEVKEDPPAHAEPAEIPEEPKGEEPAETPISEEEKTTEPEEPAPKDPPASDGDKEDTEDPKGEDPAPEAPPVEKVEESEDPMPEAAEVPEEPAAPAFIGGHEDGETEFSAESMVAVRTAEIPESYSPPTLEENPMSIPPIGAMGFEEKITPQEAGVVINRLQEDLISSLRSDISMIRDSHEREIAAIMDKHRMEMDTLNRSIGELRTQHDTEISQQSAEYQANLDSINKQNATELARQRDELNAQLKDQKQHFEEMIRKERADASKRISQIQAEANAKVKQAEEEAAAARGDERITGLQQENDTLKSGYAALYKILSGIKAELDPVDPDVRMKPIFSDSMIEDVCSSIQMVKFKYDRNDIANIIDRAIWNLNNMKGSEVEMQNLRRAVRYAINILNQAGIK